VPADTNKEPKLRVLRGSIQGRPVAGDRVRRDIPSVPIDECVEVGGAPRVVRGDLLDRDDAHHTSSLRRAGCAPRCRSSHWSNARTTAGHPRMIRCGPRDGRSQPCHICVQPSHVARHSRAVACRGPARSPASDATDRAGPGAAPRAGPARTGSWPTRGEYWPAGRARLRRAPRRPGTTGGDPSAPGSGGGRTDQAPGASPSTTPTTTCSYWSHAARGPNNSLPRRIWVGASTWMTNGRRRVWWKRKKSADRALSVRPGRTRPPGDLAGRCLALRFRACAPVLQADAQPDRTTRSAAPASDGRT
jgi:hypothetical protein